MYAYVSDGATAGHRAIIYPSTGMVRTGQEGELGAGGNDFADFPSRYQIAKPRGAFFEAKDVSDSQKNFGIAGRLDHLPALVSIHGHGFLAKHGLSTRHGGEHVGHVTGIRCSNEYGVDLSGSTEFSG